MLDVDSRSQPYEVSALDAAGVLDYVRDAEARARAADRSKLRLALQYCLVHQVADPEQAATWGEGERQAADCDVRLGNEGTPMVRAGVGEAFGAALGVSTGSGMSWLQHAMDICYRFPLLAAQVEELVLAVWKARKVAEFTWNLSVEACAFVDRELAGRARGFGIVTIENIIAIAIARFHPELLPDAEEVARAGWDVTLDHATLKEFTGTSSIRASGDTLGFTRFYELVCTVATALGRLGDTDTFNQRKSKAIGIIADPDELLALLERAENLTNDQPPNDQPPDQQPKAKAKATPGTGTQPGTQDKDSSCAGSGGGGGGGGRRPRSTRVAGSLRKPARVKLHLHLNAADLAGLAAETGETYPLGHVEKLGPVTQAKIKQWLATSGATITPVIDLNRTDAVDSHDPPEWMRQLVILRDGHCVFPWCARDARSCDLDHIEPYHHGTDGTRAPPGQTRPDGLAALCRMHHRAKTFHGWTYRRLPDGSYRWKDPYGHTYRVDENGTTDLG